MSDFGSVGPVQFWVWFWRGLTELFEVVELISLRIPSLFMKCLPPLTKQNKWQLRARCHSKTPQIFSSCGPLRMDHYQNRPFKVRHLPNKFTDTMHGNFTNYRLHGFKIFEVLRSFFSFFRALTRAICEKAIKLICSTKWGRHIVGKFFIVHSLLVYVHSLSKGCSVNSNCDLQRVQDGEKKDLEPFLVWIHEFRSLSEFIKYRRRLLSKL